MIPLALRAEGFIQQSSKWGGHIPLIVLRKVSQEPVENLCKADKTHQFSYKLQLKNTILVRWLEMGS